MDVRIGKTHFFIRSDIHQYILVKETEIKKEGETQGKLNYKEMYYYRTIQDLLDDLVEMHIRIGNISDLENLSKRIESTHKLIDTVCKSRNWVDKRKDGK